MSVITVVGSGMMGSALAIPATDNGHEVRLVGTHLDRDIVASLKRDGTHPTLKAKMPDGVSAYFLEEIDRAMKGCDLVIGGVSSFGVTWFAREAMPHIPDSVPVLSVTKGLEDQPDGTLLTLPEVLRRNLPAGRHPSLNAIGGACTSYELAARHHTVVCFCGEDMAVLERFRKALATPYYHVCCSTDVVGVESAVALKNAYALGVSLAIGLQERVDGVGCVESYNTQAALFGQSVREMRRLLALLGGGHDKIELGASDLYVTIFGGRTRKLGILLGRGLTFRQAREELAGVTLESVEIATRTARAVRNLASRGAVRLEDFPLMMHVDAILNGGSAVAIPWDSFTG